MTQTVWYRVTVTEKDGTVTPSVPQKELVLNTQTPHLVRQEVLKLIDEAMRTGPMLLQVEDDIYEFIRNPQKVTVKFF